VAIAAGQFDTEVLRTKYPREVSENVARTIPLGRLGRPEELAWMVAYLASPAGDFTSGTVITIDGARDDWLGPWPPPAITGEAGEPLAEERRARDG
jgi:citronellol/citronellal dehydrogenase